MYVFSLEDGEGPLTAAQPRQGDEIPVLGDLLLALVPLSGVALQGPLQLEPVNTTQI